MCKVGEMRVELKCNIRREDRFSFVIAFLGRVVRNKGVVLNFI